MNKSGSKRKSSNKTPSKSKSKGRRSKSRSRSKNKNESTIKRPQNPFLLFCADKRAENDRDGGSPLTVQELSKMWGVVSESKKKFYEKKFDELVEEYKEK